jgi:hypothetical protein
MVRQLCRSCFLTAVFHWVSGVSELLPLFVVTTVGIHMVRAWLGGRVEGFDDWLVEPCDGPDLL